MSAVATAEVLTTAIGALEALGGAQGDDDAALRTPARADPHGESAVLLFHRAAAALLRAAGVPRGAGSGALLPVTLVEQWNDDPSRTVDEVLAALREGAAS